MLEMEQMSWLTFGGVTFHENSDGAAAGQASWLETGGEARASLEATATCDVPELYNSGVIYDPSVPEFSKS